MSPYARIRRRNTVSLCTEQKAKAEVGSLGSDDARLSDRFAQETPLHWNMSL